MVQDRMGWEDRERQRETVIEIQYPIRLGGYMNRIYPRGVQKDICIPRQIECQRRTAVFTSQGAVIHPTIHPAIHPSTHPTIQPFSQLEQQGSRFRGRERATTTDTTFLGN